MSGQYAWAPKVRLSVVVKETISILDLRQTRLTMLKRRFIVPNEDLPADQRLMLINSASISSAVVMIFDEAE